MRILNAKQKHSAEGGYISALEKKYQEAGMLTKFEERPPRGLPIVHGFLALLVSHHSRKVLPEIGHAIGDAIDRYYFGGERERHQRHQKEPQGVCNAGRERVKGKQHHN